MSVDSNVVSFKNDRLTVFNATFMWTIQNFSKYNCLNEIESPEFSVKCDCPCTLRLYLYPWSDSENTVSALEIDIKSSEEPKHVLQFTFTIINNKGEKTRISRVTADKKKEFAISVEDFININTAKNEANGLLYNDQLRILCDVKTLSNEFNVLFEDFSTQFQLSKDIEIFFDNKKFSDVTLIDASGKKIYAHKMLLAARSAAFAGMFEHNMKEQNEGVVTIPNIEYKCLREMLRFIYTGKVENLEDMAVDLLTAADQYGLDGLKQICENVLCINFTVDTAIVTLVTAEKYNASLLKTKVLQFIVDNSQSIIDTEGFKSLESSHVGLVKEILCAIVQSKIQ